MNTCRNIESPFHIFVICIFALFTIGSCCTEKDRVYWFPDEAVRYYNENDTVTFYCPEFDLYESYIVCNRDTSKTIEQYHESPYCEPTVIKYSLRYILYLDSCGSSKHITVFIDTPNPGNIRVSIYQPDSDSGGSHVSFDESTKFSTDVFGFSYHNVIEIPGSESYEIPSILFSYEFGVIQIKYEDRTFSLVNNDD